MDNGENDILFYQKISNILSAIGFGGKDAERGNSWIDAEGNYRLGVLEGTITKEYQARFIGAVSYTHLDVYKRQVADIGIGKFK